MENVLTLTLWLLPVAGVLALNTQEFIEEKMSNSKRGFIDWNHLMSCRDIILVCQQDVCGCDASFTATIDDDDDYYEFADNQTNDQDNSIEKI
jgi:hypothetical protein